MAELSGLDDVALALAPLREARDGGPDAVALADDLGEAENLLAVDLRPRRPAGAERCDLAARDPLVERRDADAEQLRGAALGDARPQLSGQRPLDAVDGCAGLRL